MPIADLKWLGILQQKGGGKFYSTNSSQDALDEALQVMLQGFPSDGSYKLLGVVLWDEACACGYGVTMGLDRFQDWASKVLAEPTIFFTQGEYWFAEGEQPQPSKPAPLIKGKPRLELIQDWVSKLERDQPGELGKRAWDAVQAMCKD